MFSTNNDIPVYFSNDKRYIVVSSIDISMLDIAYEDFQELYEEEVNVILLVRKKYPENQEVILMDVMRDMLKIGRDLRRKIAKQEQEKLIIKEKGPAIEGKILAIYT